MSQNMLVCPECKTVQYPEIIEICPVCGKGLIPKPAKAEAPDDLSVSVEVDFTILGCDVCGAKNTYRSITCHACKNPLTDDEGDLFIDKPVDPIVQRRRQALAPLFTMQEKMLNSEIQTESVEVDPEEEEYRLEFIRLSETFTQQTDKLRRCLTSIDFRGRAIDTMDFKAQIVDLQNQYNTLFQLTKQILSTSSPATWNTLHESFRECVEDVFKGYLSLLDTLYVEDLKDAGNLTRIVTSQWDNAGHKLLVLTSIVMAGKQLRYGKVESLPEAIADENNGEMSMLEWAEKGWFYFADLFVRDREELPEEHGLSLAIFATLAESFDSPYLFRSRAASILDLLRRADAMRRDSLKYVTDDLQDDFSHARALLFDIGQQIIATDFTKLQPRQEFKMALRTYHTLSEGVFKHLLTILIFCELLIEGDSPDYDEISRRSFGSRVKRHKPGKPKSLADSSDPIIAALADDLVMYIRHADAHYDFRFEQDRVIVFERHHGNRKILDTHDYTQEEFVTLANKLFEAVCAMLLGILCLQIELHEIYSLIDETSLLREEKYEFSKFLFATNGVIVEGIEQETSTQNED